MTNEENKKIYEKLLFLLVPDLSYVPARSGDRFCLIDKKKCSNVSTEKKKNNYQN